MSKIEEFAQQLWHQWAEFQMYTLCACCQVMRTCGRRSRRGRWLCLPCFDTSPEADRMLRERSGVG